MRATVEDLAAVPVALAAWRGRAVEELGPGDEIVRAIDAETADWDWRHGEIAGADAVRARAQLAVPNEHAQRITGVVVDAHGKPVAGATVTAGLELRGDSLHAAIAINNRDSMRSTTSGPDGRFELADAVEHATVIAELGAHRSLPSLATDDVKLAFAPTSRLEGHVDLAGQVAPAVVVSVRDIDLAVPWAYAVVAPVAPDGSFSIDGVPRRAVLLFASVDAVTEQIFGGTTIVVKEPVVRGLTLSLVKSKRVVHVLVRNTINAKIINAQVVVLAGKVPSMTAKAITQELRGATIQFARQLEGEHVPKQVAAAARPGDLYATATGVPEGVASACALPLPDLDDDEIGRKALAHLDKIPVICTPIPAHADLVTVEIPPFPRLD